MNVAIIGCGLIGRKRALALKPYTEDHLKIVCDIDGSRAEALAHEFECEYQIDWGKVIYRSDIEMVINSSINSVLEPITIAALKAGKHVLREKPLGRDGNEARRMVEAASQNGVYLKTGFNHRFHPALWKAKEMVDKGSIGKILTVRARYGHGGRPGMEKEWRSSKELCGGGELLDQGVHVIDLIRWYGGEITEVFGKTETKFWNMKVEDNAFVILKTENDVTACFHVSWTNWKNVFSFEIFGEDGYLFINGLGGSYGKETLEWGKRKKEGGRPDVEFFEFIDEDVSWENEWKEFITAIREKREPIGNGYDGWMANRVIDKIYKSSKEKRVIKIL